MVYGNNLGKWEEMLLENSLIREGITCSCIMGREIGSEGTCAPSKFSDYKGDGRKLVVSDLHDSVKVAL